MSEELQKQRFTSLKNLMTAQRATMQLFFKLLVRLGTLAKYEAICPNIYEVIRLLDDTLKQAKDMLYPSNGRPLSDNFEKLKIDLVKT